LKLEKQTEIWLRELMISEPESIHDDFNEIINSDRAAQGIQLLTDIDLLEKLLPELEACRGVEQFGGYHHLDVFDHSVEALARLITLFPKSTLETRLATLLHDVGKPVAKTWDVVRKRWSFFAHDQIGAKVAREILSRMGYSEPLIQRVSKMVDHHMLRLPADKPSAARFVRRNQDILPDLLQVMIADREAARGVASNEQSRIAYQQQIDLVLEAMTEDSSLKPLMDGEQVMAFLKLEPGKAVGLALEFLRTLQESGEVKNLEQAKTALLEWAKIQNQMA
jgi:poly(A) polymerase